MRYKKISYANSIKELLKERGITDIDSFLNPPQDYLLNPFDLDNMAAGVELLNSSLNDEKKIMIIQDCDVDGIASATIMHNYIKDLKPEQEVDFFIHEGKQHGFEDCWEIIAEKIDDYSIIIAPDSASNDYEFISNLSIPVLVLDHHILEDNARISDNCILINNQSSPKYRNKNLSGSGVTWQFCKAYDDTYRFSYANKYIDLAAFGIIGDMMDVIEPENRWFIYNGMKYPTQNYFLNRLIEKQAYSLTGNSDPDMSTLNDSLNPVSVAFSLVPMVNALIRVGTRESKERLLNSFLDGRKLVPSNKRGEKGLMVESADETIRECTNAKAAQDRIKKRVTEDLEIKILKEDLLSNAILFIELDEDKIDFPNELTGLIAMELCSKYNKPTIIVRKSPDGACLKGSSRGLSTFDLKGLKSFFTDSGYFMYAQGHEWANGVGIEPKNVQPFINYSNEKLKNVNFNEKVLNVDFIETCDNTQSIEKLAREYEMYHNLFGQGNAEPLMVIENIHIDSREIYAIGQNKNTLRFKKNGVTYIKFFASKELDELAQYSGNVVITLAGIPKINEWRGTESVQVEVKEIMIEEDNIFSW